MRVGINTRNLLADKLEGFGWYTFEVTKRMVLSHPEVEFYFFFDRKFDPKYIFADNVKPIVLHPQARHPILFKIWFNYSITKALKKYKIDVFFSPDGFLSLKTDVKQVGVIHDINFEHFPNDLPNSASKYLRKYFPLFAKKADRILTVSEYSKKDIIDQYKIAEEKVIVGYNGIHEGYLPIEAEEQKKVQAELTGGNEFMLYVGSIHPRKNLQRLLKAYEDYKSNNKSDLKFLVVGDRYWWTEDLANTLNSMKFKNEVVFTGHIDQKKLRKVYSSAKFLAYVSYFEGFGLPVGEAMQSGTAVLCGDKTSIPEVGGDAAHYIDPFDVDSIAKGIEKLDKDDQYRSELVLKGIEQAKKFDWNHTAEIAWKALEF